MEKVEVKGHSPEFHWGNAKYELRAYQSGQLAKVPREALRRADELMSTTRFTRGELSRLVSVIPQPESITKVRLEKADLGIVQSTCKHAGSISGLSISTGLAEQIRGGHLEIARDLFPRELRTGKGRAVLAEDMAVLLAILLFCAENPNADGSIPTERIRSLWQGRERQGYTDRAWDHHRFKVLRDWLSQNRLLSWENEDYVVGQVMNGIFQKGQAAKWSASERLLSMLRENEGVVEVGVHEDEKVRGEVYQESEKRETSLWAVFHPDNLPYELPGWQFTWKTPRFTGYAGESGRQAA